MSRRTKTQNCNFVWKKSLTDITTHENNTKANNSTLSTKVNAIFAILLLFQNIIIRGWFNGRVTF